ncbi:MAG: DUF924 family protein [Rhodospirillales bacterium]
MREAGTNDPGAVLDFWFSVENQPYWFEQNADFDRRVAERLGDLYRQAVAGNLEIWSAAPEGCLALTLLLDQVPRNLFRGSAASFASDAQALALARKVIKAGHDLKIAGDKRHFLYLPFEHSEDLGDQYLSLALIAALPDKELRHWAAAHLQVIERFGRFPHRNAVLGRPSTAEERAYLAEPNGDYGKWQVQTAAGPGSADPQ